jgi:hypothetical protein
MVPNLPSVAETEPKDPVLLTTRVSTYPVGPVKLPLIFTPELKVAAPLVVRVLKLAVAPVNVPEMLAFPLDVSEPNEPPPPNTSISPATLVRTFEPAYTDQHVVIHVNAACPLPPSEILRLVAV